ncbi:MAG: dihydropteroate synthase [Eubacteriaceae bacterium]|nr:dihydropteroate synthase [Eubacteriaceae bacterium]
MIIIGEKLNGSIPSCAKAIANKDEDYIKKMARRQAQAGSAFIDVCASLKDGELEAMEWMVKLVQSVTDCPISLDSPDVNVILDAMAFCDRPGLLNSVSGEGDKLDLALPVLANPENEDWEVMALLCDDTGIPKSAAKRIEIFDKIMEKAKEFGIEDKRIHIDPLVEMLCTADEGEGISMLLEVMAHIKATHPNVHISGAISNISFHLPERKLVNQAFAALAINAGMDSAVMDPLEKDLRGVVYAIEAMLGLDDYCMEYTQAYRAGIFGKIKK